MPHQEQQRINFYRGKHPAEIPTYFVAEAAHYLLVPPATIRAWIMGREYVRAGSRVRSRPLVVPADKKGKLLSFVELAELHVISFIRRIHGVRLNHVRTAINYLSKEFSSAHPLLQQQMLTDGTSLFIEQYGEHVNISQDGQMQMKLVLEAYLDRIEWDASGLPARLFPVTRKRASESPRLVTIDPRIRFGSPCIAGTIIPTAIVAERYLAGDSIVFLAKDYGRSTEEIEEAVRYESRAAA